MLAGQRRQRPVEFTRGDEIQTDCSKSELLCARQNGRHISHRGSNETNDGTHQRGLEQTRQVGKVPCPIPQMVNWYKYQDESDQAPAYTDSDWAGCGRTRRSTSGGCSHRGQHMLKFWSKTQAAVSMSSAEAELGTSVNASQEVLWIMPLWKDEGETTRGHLTGDASGAIGCIRLIGSGKVRRHLTTSCWWVQWKDASRELPATTALTCSPRHLHMIASCDTLKPWVVSSCLGKTQSHSLSTTCVQT